MLGPLRWGFGLLRRLRHDRTTCSSGREWLLSQEGTAHGAALGLGCCAVVAQRGHHCEWCKQACKTRFCVHCLREMFFLQGGRRLRRCAWVLLRCAWVLLRGAEIGAAGHLLGSSQDTRHDLAFSSSADLLWSTLRFSRICGFPLCAPQQINWFRRSWAVAVEWRTLNAVSETSLLTPLVGPLRSNFTCLRVLISSFSCSRGPFRRPPLHGDLSCLRVF